VALIRARGCVASGRTTCSRAGWIAGHRQRSADCIPAHVRARAMRAVTVLVPVLPNGSGGVCGVRAAVQCGMALLLSALRRRVTGRGDATWTATGWKTWAAAGGALLLGQPLSSLLTPPNAREGLANGPGLTTRAYVIPTRVQPHAEPVRTSGRRCWQDSQHAPKSRHGNKLAVNLVVFTSLRTRVKRKSAVRAARSVLESLCTCIPPHTSPCRVSPATHFQTRTYSSDTIAPVSGDGVEQVRPDPAYSKPRAPVKQMCLFSYCSLDSSRRYFPSKNTDLTKLHKLPNKSNLRGIRSGKDRDMSHTNVSEPKLTVCVAS
jgi:hypothetical protein